MDTDHTFYRHGYAGAWAAAQGPASQGPASQGPVPQAGPPPRRPHHLLPIAIPALVLEVVAAGYWLLCSLGVAMCTDGRSSATCHTVGRSYGLYLIALLINGALGLAAATDTTSRPGTTRFRALLGLHTGGIAALVIAVAWFQHLASTV